MADLADDAFIEELRQAIAEDRLSSVISDNGMIRVLDRLEAAERNVKELREALVIVTHDDQRSYIQEIVRAALEASQ